MTANEILKNFEEGLQMEDQSEGQDIDLNKVILDILKYLDYKESGGNTDRNFSIVQSWTDKLWSKIGETSFNFADEGAPVIELPKLRQILEEFKVLGDEKDGM